MPALLPAWLKDAADGLRRLADRPWTLFALLLAMNAIARPVSITTHDAGLYSLQVLNQAEHGAYADDVFLRFGSQDNFSLFSRAIGPMIAAFGLRLGFFAVYLVFNTIFILAILRLVRALIDDPLIASLASMYLVTAPLNYGGHDVFMVHEQFVTPRTIGSTLTLFALERLLRQRYASALALLAAGVLMHPLMAFGGVLIWIGYLAFRYLPPRALAALLIASCVGSVMVLGIPALGTRIFGSMDADWRHLVRIAGATYNFPETWQVKDWLNLAVSLAVPMIACFSLYGDDPVRRPFLLVVALVGMVGFLASVGASVLPYALLFQGQPYRVLWILRVVQVPVGFLLIVHWSQSTRLVERIAALGLVLFFCLVHYISREFVFVGAALAGSLIVGKIRDAETNPDWWCYAAARGFVLGAVVWMLDRFRFFLTELNVVGQFCDLDEWMMFDLVGPVVSILAVCVAVRFAANDRVLRWSALTIALLTPIALVAVEVSPAYRRQHTRLGPDIAFLHDYLQKRAVTETRRPNIYYPLGRSDQLWIDVEATSYFSVLQTAGMIFNRSTAKEIERRAQVVSKFEMARKRETAMFQEEDQYAGYDNLFKLRTNCAPPTQEDLARLCAEPGLDVVVIPEEFPGLYSATNGRIFVYECRNVRGVLGVDSTTKDTARPSAATKKYE